MKTASVLFVLAASLCGVSAQAQTLDELHKKALSEGGTLNFYATLAQVNATAIVPAFEKRFPGIKVNHVDATSDQLAARIIAESRGGKVIADIFQTHEFLNYSAALCPGKAPNGRPSSSAPSH